LAERILLIDDDARLAAMVSEYLGAAGYRVTTAASGASGLERLGAQSYDALVLDLSLPDMDGLEVCRRLRARSDLPVLMLTARGDEEDRIVGLELGADDYLPKPFNPRELLARLNAVLRRRGPDEAPGAPAQDIKSVEFGEFVLDLQTRTLTRSGEPVPLTTGEFAVLKVFARYPRIPLSREKLMEMARGREYEAFDRSLDVQISRLRKLLEPDPSKPRYIQTVWGLGYVFIPDGQS